MSNYYRWEDKLRRQIDWCILYSKAHVGRIQRKFEVFDEMDLSIQAFYDTIAEDVSDFIEKEVCPLAAELFFTVWRHWDEYHQQVEDGKKQPLNLLGSKRLLEAIGER